ncbi:hypothetical protein PAMC26510_00555 [Caballeronia sordidicola]|uniref:Uncharacterized protein n=1 Tax=Caballeronia sordidicola TaxID=196367 RepID=A0A242NBZ5_CABSO|nr:hypothetical protein PAMC26510_00555 [Caballeronia sordidicola]
MANFALDRIRNGASSSRLIDGSGDKNGASRTERPSVHRMRDGQIEER